MSEPPKPNAFKRASVKLPAQFNVDTLVDVDDLNTSSSSSSSTNNTNTVPTTTTTNTNTVTPPPLPPKRISFGGSRLQTAGSGSSPTTSSHISTEVVSVADLIDDEPVSRPRTTRAKTLTGPVFMGKPMGSLRGNNMNVGGQRGLFIGGRGGGGAVDLSQPLVDVSTGDEDQFKKVDLFSNSKPLPPTPTTTKKEDNNGGDDDDDDDDYVPRSNISFSSVMSKTKSQGNTAGRGSGRFVIGSQTQVNGTVTNEQTGEEENLEPTSRRGTFRKAIVIGSHENLLNDDDQHGTQSISSLDLATVQRPKQQYHTIDPASIPNWKKDAPQQQPTTTSTTTSGTNGGTFANMTSSFASLLKSSPAKQTSGQPGHATKSKAELEYNEYLDKARQSTFSEIAALNFIYQAGKDNLGRTVIVIVASHLPAKQVDMERVLLYTITIMDPVVEGDYVLVYAHTNMNNENKPSFAWLKKVYTIFNRKYKKNLKGLYIVHPTTWIKFTLRLFKPFLSSKFWRKLVYIDDLSELFKFFSKEQLNLPQHIMMHKPAGRKAQPIFGAPLEDVVSRPDNPGEIPQLFEKGLAYLEKRALLVEGIFRLSGANSQIKSLKNCFDAGEEVDLNDCEDVHTVAGLLKLYLRELPEPLFPFETYSSFIEISKGDVPKQQKIDSVKLLVSLLPAPNRALFRHLFRFLEKVYANAGVNKMNAVNLSIVFAPNLLKDKDNNVMNVVADAQYVNHVVQLIIENVNQIIV